MTRPTFITLGPSGTCHENALLHYLEFQGIDAYEVVLVEDLLGAIERVRDAPRRSSCSAAPTSRSTSSPSATTRRCS